MSAFCLFCSAEQSLDSILFLIQVTQYKAMIVKRFDKMYHKIQEIRGVSSDIDVADPIPPILLIMESTDASEQNQSPMPTPRWGRDSNKSRESASQALGNSNRRSSHTIGSATSNTGNTLPGDLIYTKYANLPLPLPQQKSFDEEFKKTNSKSEDTMNNASADTDIECGIVINDAQNDENKQTADGM